MLPVPGEAGYEIVIHISEYFKKAIGQ